ncbi:MAG: DUF4157 domain-containing protein, partial [Pseudarthrobacter sp.]
MSGFYAAESVVGTPGVHEGEAESLPQRGATDPERVHSREALPAAGDGGGQRLPAATGLRMRQALGHDFASVRIHTDAGAAGYAERLGARAATVGSHIFFNTAEFRPDTNDGERLIGHELAHVVQQSGGDRRPSGPVDAERAA